MRITKASRSLIDLISDRIADVGFGDETEEDFYAVKVELEDDELATEEELNQITFEDWVNSKDLKEGIMRITKSQLRRIIKEELSRVLDEDVGQDFRDATKKGMQQLADLARDMSASMDATDADPSRLEQARRELANLVELLDTDLRNELSRQQQLELTYVESSMMHLNLLHAEAGTSPSKDEIKKAYEEGLDEAYHELQMEDDDYLK